MALCIHEMERENCGFCRIPPGAIPREQVTKTAGTEDWGQLAEAVAQHDSDGRGPWFEAKFDSACASCGRPIRTGSQCRADDDLGDFVCHDCGSKAA